MSQAAVGTTPFIQPALLVAAIKGLQHFAQVAQELCGGLLGHGAARLSRQWAGTEEGKTGFSSLEAFRRWRADIMQRRVEGSFMGKVVVPSEPHEEHIPWLELFRPLSSTNWTWVEYFGHEYRV